MNLYEGEAPGNHFYGQIVIHNDETSQKNIIDGQQRISTSIILLDAFRTVYRIIYGKSKMDAKYEIEDITTMYIGRTSDKCFESRLFLNDDDRIFFAERI